MPSRINLIGKTFGDLQVIGYSETNHWLCLCHCGKFKVVRSGNLKSGHTNSCGCRKKTARATHGLSKHNLYQTWQHIILRCTNPKDKRFKYYGGRGITVYPAWVLSFEAFLKDMGEKPTPQHTVDRKDNSLGYTPDNCVWATRSEQARNTRRNVMYAVDGVDMLQIDVCQKFNIKPSTMRSWIKKGITKEDIILNLKKEVDTMI